MLGIAHGEGVHLYIKHTRVPIQYLWVKHILFLFRQGRIILNRMKSDNSGLKWGKVVRENNFKKFLQINAIVEEIFIILPIIFGSSGRNLMNFWGGKF